MSERVTWRQALLHFGKTTRMTLPKPYVDHLRDRGYSTDEVDVCYDEQTGGVIVTPVKVDQQQASA